MLKLATRATENKRLAQEAVARRQMRTYDDPVRDALERQTRADAPTGPLTGVLTDTAGNPSETINLAHYGAVMAAKEQLRRSAE